MGALGTAIEEFNPGLTVHEISLLQYIADGKDNIEIALLMNVERPQTIGKRVQRILDRTGTASRSAAVAWAMRRGLIR